jgi:hypothetical protein
VVFFFKHDAARQGRHSDLFKGRTFMALPMALDR